MAMNQDQFDYSFLKRYNIPQPPEFSGYSGAGGENQQPIYSLGGRWMSQGQKNADGYSVKSFDAKNNVAYLDWNGVNVPVKMKQSVVTPYVPSVAEDSLQAKLQEIRQKVIGGGTLSNYEQELLQNPAVFGGSKSPVPKDQMETIIQNTQNSPFMTDEQKKNIIHKDDWQSMIESGKIKPDTDYFVPMATEDGNVDFDVYRFNKESK